jgi:integrase
VALETHQGERNSLIFSWAEETGARRSEILQVKKTQLPNLDQLARMLDLDEPWSLWVVRKGGTSRELPIPADLVIRALDYIEYERTTIVKRARGLFVGYREPDELFLSSSTGLPLRPDSVTVIGRRMFKKAGIKNANIHRLRARFAVRTIEVLVEAALEETKISPDSSFVETILVKAAELMSHGHPESLRPYLNYVLNRRLQTSDAMTSKHLEAKIRMLRQQVAVVDRRLNQTVELSQAAKAMREGRHVVAARQLRALADSSIRPKVAKNRDVRIHAWG